MGLFDDASGQAVPGGGLAKPLMLALGALFVGKMLSGGGSQDAAQDSSSQSGGGLSGLLNKLSNAGHGDKVSSWIGNGPNQPIEPAQLGQALGPQTVSNLAQQSGMSEDDVLSQLSQNLPGIIDKLTANGQVPSEQDLAKLL
ncbi:YidB family protein [Brucella sp. IR073]|uniref:YidB family protein n=1 Tax=unclassified Brucella TaxID=2632610 RepID=UPI003B981F2E